MTGIDRLIERYIKAQTDEGRLALLNEDPQVTKYLSQPNPLTPLLPQLTTREQVLLKSLLAIEQGPYLFADLTSEQKLKDFLADLDEVECFYRQIGGLIGYHAEVLKLIHASHHPSQQSELTFLYPEGTDISQENQEVRQAIQWGLEHFAEMAALFPVGGAGDRLDLRDEKTGEPLPAAQLPFLGRNLLVGLIRDLQAIEHLYFKVYGRQLVTPIAFMTSHEKNNHAHILNICESHNWFGRPSSSFRFFTQSLVPVISEHGQWVLKEPMKLALKPGGHGVLWHLAETNGIFDWFKDCGRRKLLIRQINNPIAGLDFGILAFLGIGCKQDKLFGFASCFRLLNTAEGVNVLIERKPPEGYSYSLTNIEYTDFVKHGITDEPASPGSSYSKFPANTNILFADFYAIKELLKISPIPGKIINLKHQKTPSGDQIKAGRLESTMQNIADYLLETFPDPLPEGQRSCLKSFITFNKREKTISVTKKKYTPGQSSLETPEDCFYDLLLNTHDLLKNHCSFKLPPLPTREEYLKHGPPFIALFHPALGPLYHIIAQKLRYGTIEIGSFLQLEIAELNAENLHLSGSLSIEALQPLENSRCLLHNVTIHNKGINWPQATNFWKNQLPQQEACTIRLHGNAEFSALDVTLNGAHHFEVPHGHHLAISQQNGQIKQTLTKIEEPSWYWQYRLDNCFVRLDVVS